MVDFKSLKKNAKSNFEHLNKRLDSLEKKSYGDENTWYPAVDKSGNGFAVIRFLPAPGEELDPYVLFYDHFFQGPGGWYVEKSRTTIGEDDPVSEYNSTLWNAGNQDGARKQKRRKNFITNIYVVQDKLNPENNGKVFKYLFGPKIHEKIKEAMQPSFEDATPFNPFDLWEGANFKIKIKTVEGQRNYDSSEFEECGPLFDDDKKLEAIWKQEFGLYEYIDPTKYKSYDELKSRLAKVLKLNEDKADALKKSFGSKKFESNDDEDELKKILEDEDSDHPF